MDKYELANRIRTYREIRNYTQTFMAIQLDMSTRGYSKLENGETTISVVRLYRIAAIFNVPLVDLLTIDPQKLITSNTRIFDHERSEMIAHLEHLLEVLKRK